MNFYDEGMNEYYPIFIRFLNEYFVFGEDFEFNGFSLNGLFRLYITNIQFINIYNPICLYSMIYKLMDEKKFVKQKIDRDQKNINGWIIKGFKLKIDEKECIKTIAYCNILQNMMKTIKKRLEIKNPNEYDKIFEEFTYGKNYLSFVSGESDIIPIKNE